MAERDPNFLVQQLNLLFTGYGYNLYNEVNRARADDQLVRQKVSGFLGEAVNRLAQVASEYQRVNVPPPSREHPFPEASVMQPLHDLERLRARLSGLSSTVRGLSTPNADRTWARFRNEKGLLYQLLSFDYELVSGARDLQEHAQQMSGATWEPERATRLEGMIGELEQGLRARSQLLTA